MQQCCKQFSGNVSVVRLISVKSSRMMSKIRILRYVTYKFPCITVELKMQSNITYENQFAMNVLLPCLLKCAICNLAILTVFGNSAKSDASTSQGVIYQLVMMRINKIRDKNISVATNTTVLDTNDIKMKW